MRRVVLAVILWMLVAVFSTQPQPEDYRECYLSAVWNGYTWEYGKQVCLP